MSIDWWTIGIQVVNLVVLIWLLGRFFWTPVAAMIEKRRATAAALLGDAKAAREEASAALADIKHTREGFEKERSAIISAAHVAAEKVRDSILAAAQSEAAALSAAAAAELEKQGEAAQKAWADGAALLAIDIARRLIARLDGPAVNAMFQDCLLREIHNLPADMRAAMTAEGVVLTAVSSAPWSAADQQRCAQLMDNEFKARVQLEFKEDPALIAGVELHGPHVIVTNSWRADLARIQAELSHGLKP